MPTPNGERPTPSVALMTKDDVDNLVRDTIKALPVSVWLGSSSIHRHMSRHGRMPSSAKVARSLARLAEAGEVERRLQTWGAEYKGQWGG